jgi:hypothetical protein
MGEKRWTKSVICKDQAQPKPVVFNLYRNQGQDAQASPQQKIIPFIKK